MTAFVDRAKETTTATGTSDLLLLGASPGYQSLPNSFSDDFYYCIAHTSEDEWEVGIGNASSGSLQRITILDGSAGADVPVDFSAGTKDVFCTCPAIMQQVAKPMGSATGETSDNTPTDITVQLTPVPSNVGGFKFLFVRYTVFAYKTAMGGSMKAWEGRLVYANGVATDSPTVIHDPDANGWDIEAHLGEDESFKVAVTGDASSSTFWTIAATVECSVENGA